jgi:hypothetical protein
MIAPAIAGGGELLQPLELDHVNLKSRTLNSWMLETNFHGYLFG